jgi:hypothetical protein
VQVGDEEQLGHTLHFTEPNWGHDSVFMIAECHLPGAVYNDNFWFDDGGDGYSEYPANSGKLIRATVALPSLDCERFPVLGMECPHCEVTRAAVEMHKHESCESQSRGEQLLRETLEKLYNKAFPNTRPAWLVNPETGHPLELDCYNEELRLAFEYQGRQHYEPVTFFGGEEAHKKILRRDNTKRRICEQRGISLFEVDGRRFPSTTKAARLRRHIMEISEGS